MKGRTWRAGSSGFRALTPTIRKHTPLARISVTLLPYLDGLRGYGNASFWEEGVLILSTGGRYWHNLTLARIGVLPFFVWAVVVIFLWTKRVYGNATGLIAAGIFSMLPVMLGHSAACDYRRSADGVLYNCGLCFHSWLSNPNWRTAVGFGIATGLAISTKLSAVAFLPMTMIGVLPLYLATSRNPCPTANR